MIKTTLERIIQIAQAELAIEASKTNTSTLSFDKDLVGLDYVRAIIEVIEIRADRAKLYGEAYKKDSDDFLLAQIKNKLDRVNVQLQLKSENITIGYENLDDSIIDAINYLLFLKINNKNKTN